MIRTPGERMHRNEIISKNRWRLSRM